MQQSHNKSLSEVLVGRLKSGIHSFSFNLSLDQSQSLWATAVAPSSSSCSSAGSAAGEGVDGDSAICWIRTLLACSGLLRHGQRYSDDVHTAKPRKAKIASTTDMTIRGAHKINVVVYKRVGSKRHSYVILATVSGKLQWVSRLFPL